VDAHKKSGLEVTFPEKMGRGHISVFASLVGSSSSSSGSPLVVVVVVGLVDGAVIT
jgi:hypothetical protein